jgi:hypothetical protein
LAYLDVLALVDEEGDEAATGPQTDKAAEASRRVGGHAGRVLGGGHTLHTAPLADVVLGAKARKKKRDERIKKLL